ncbi:MAG: polyprenyl synthetase family protein [Ruminiclostridium sp.]|nr:polyprenyl synthetase family protein [Ruminiclostridium sp.]
MWKKYPEIRFELEQVEKFIIENSSSRNKLLSKISQELAMSGGKRLRPSFVIISAKFGEYDSQKLLPLAGAIEILHMATLVHDDVVDQASLRRGKPTVSEKYGIDMAVYTGDFLFTKAVLMLSKNVSTDKLDYIARAVKTVCEGEVDQLCERFDTNVTFRSYLKRISKKTAGLFGAACLIGADAGGCAPELSKKLARFGYYYGIAFQIRDDMLDFLSNTDASGKPVGNDIIKGVFTLPVIYAISGNDTIKEIFSKTLCNKEKNLDNKDIAAIRRLVIETGGMTSSGEMLATYIARGLKVADSLPDSQYCDIFRELIANLKV